MFVVAFVLPVAAASGVGYFVWSRWDGKFGRIRLGETAGGAPRWAMGDAWDAEQPWIKYPVAAAAGIVAVLAAAPLLLGAAARAVRSRFAGTGGHGRYTSRAAFARSRGEYAVVDPLEDELLGDDEEEL